MPNDKK